VTRAQSTDSASATYVTSWAEIVFRSSQTASGLGKQRWRWSWSIVAAVALLGAAGGSVASAANVGAGRLSSVAPANAPTSATASIPAAGPSSATASTSANAPTLPNPTSEFPVVGMVADPAVPTGYWVVASNGGVYAFGDAGFAGSVHVLPLAGLTVAIDPGHDGGNGAAPQIIDQPIDGGGFTEPCDTAGTETADGYTEHAFNFDVATRAASLLEAEGATVVLTRTTDTGSRPRRASRTAPPPSW
jgi:N-acetylmuramoyl-L-alanine amidase